MKIELVYFSYPSERLMISRETADIPEGLTTLVGMLDWLRVRGEIWGMNWQKSACSAQLTRNIPVRLPALKKMTRSPSFRQFLEDDMSVLIQKPDFELAAMRSSSSKVGALVCFVGLVRDFSRDEKIENIYLEHYPGISEKALDNIISVAMVRWNFISARVVHRVGLLLPNEQIVLVATAAQQRGKAFAACELIIDYLKRMRHSGSGNRPAKALSGRRLKIRTFSAGRTGIEMIAPRAASVVHPSINKTP